MITTVTQKNMITIPVGISRQFAITPGYRFEWQAVEGCDDRILVTVIPKRSILARRLKGVGKRYSPKRDSVAELVQERGMEAQ